MIIIEPNLRSPSNHYLEFIRTLASNSPYKLTVFAHPDGDKYLKQIPNIDILNTSYRKNKLGEWILIIKLLKENRKFLVLTADSKHSFFISFLSNIFKFDPKNVFFYFHRVLNKKKDKFFLNFSEFAKKNCIVITPTEELCTLFKKGGWINVTYIEYPALPPQYPLNNKNFRHLLVAGALRINKGLNVILQLLKLLKEKNSPIPLKIQITKKHLNKHGRKEKKLLKKIFEINYSNLITFEEPAERYEYLKNYEGALVLALYDVNVFKNQVSGIVLDSLLCGTPVIATKNTWGGNLVEKFNAGITLENPTPNIVFNAINECFKNWDLYVSNAAQASKILSELHNPQKLLYFLCT